MPAAGATQAICACTSVMRNFADDNTNSKQTINMKKTGLIILTIGLTFFYSCKSKEDKVKDIVNEFLTQINDQTKTPNKELITEKFAEFFKDKSYYTAEKWDLTVKPDNDSSIIVESKGHTHNGLGQPMELLQGFSLTNKYGGWKIYNSYNLTADELDFQVVDTQWEFYWDRDKADILKDLQEKVELKILVPGYSSYYSDAKKGQLKIINNSDYDIQRVKILIEHFDSEGLSVNTSHTYVSDIIRKHGYREFDWYTGDCSKCVKQEFKINFIKESN